jgi:hypothetical protein
MFRTDPNEKGCSAGQSCCGGICNTRDSGRKLACAGRQGDDADRLRQASNQVLHAPVADLVIARERQASPECAQSPRKERRHIVHSQTPSIKFRFARSHLSESSSLLRLVPE